MTDNKKTLEALRLEIDAIDDTLHDLIMRRTKIIEGVRAVKKNDAVKIRPAREAEILYRLTARHHGAFPKRELSRIWREIIVATLGFEGPFSVAVYRPKNDPGYGELARDQYGTFTKMTHHCSAHAVFEAVREQTATVGVMPFPSSDQDDPWWKFLVSDSAETPKVIARLPFIPGSNVHNSGLDALVICPVFQEETGRDCSFLAFEAVEEIGFSNIERALGEAGFVAVYHQVWHDPNRTPHWTYLVEVFGFINAESWKLPRLLDALESPVSRVLKLGGYSTPLSENDLKPFDLTDLPPS